VPVPGLWLDLVPQGSPLEPFSVTGAGQPAPAGVPGADQIGTPVRVDGDPFVLTADGLAFVPEFAYAVHTASDIGQQLPEVEVGTHGVDIATDETTLQPEDWPEDPLHPVGGEAWCLLMQPQSDTGAPVVQLATPTDESAVFDDETQQTVEVAPGRGAIVRTSTAGVLGRGTTYLVDSSGTAYALGVGEGESAEVVLSYLGYGGVEPAAVPPTWVEQLTPGPSLTRAAARRPPEGL
jgi:hypothetical protein